MYYRCRLCKWSFTADHGHGRAVRHLTEVHAIPWPEADTGVRSNKLVRVTKKGPRS